MADSLRQFWFYLQLTLSALQSILVIITVGHIFDRVCRLSELLEETSPAHDLAQGKEGFCLLLVLLQQRDRKEDQEGFWLHINRQQLMNNMDFKLQSTNLGVKAGSSTVKQKALKFFLVVGQLIMLVGT